LSYRPARLQRLAELVPWNRSLGSLKVIKFGLGIPDTLRCAGAGASCVYSLLAAKKMGWRMRASETDPTNYRLAAKNVETNQLTSSISLVQVAPTEIFTPAVLGGEEGKEEKTVYDFSMCNPPFFTDEKQTDEESFLIEVFSLHVPYLFFWARFV
jgi:hypothetical protein